MSAKRHPYQLKKKKVQTRPAAHQAATAVAPSQRDGRSCRRNCRTSSQTNTAAKASHSRGFRSGTQPESKADGKNELVIVQKAHARIGVDFNEMGENDLVIDKTGESVEITLPALKCLDFIMNPSDTEVFSENGTWNLDDLKAVMSPAREEIEAKMNEDKDLFANARKGAEEVVTQLLETLGYTNVVVRHKPDGPVKLPSPKAGN